MNVTSPSMMNYLLFLLSSELVNDFLIAALGVEVVVEYDADRNKMMRNSHNVLKWVFGP
ncbi:hypothetical protein ACFTAO_17730 [Paenibacillus rhizoplanae]